jgi:hypothetical protein
MVIQEALKMPFEKSRIEKKNNDTGTMSFLTNESFIRYTI